MTTKSSEEILAGMDLAAEDAKEELDAIFESQDSIQELAAWMKKWYPSAGYKRLSQQLIQKV